MMERREQLADRSLLHHIEELVTEEHRLHGQASLSEAERARVGRIEVELDQCWDLLRRRRALRMSGQDPDQAALRPADIVEKYEQ